MTDTVEIQKAKTRTMTINHGETISIDPTDNKVKVPGHPYVLEGLGDKVLLALDRYLSGYECKICKGVGRIKTRCSCENTDRPGFKYDSDHLSNFDDTTIKQTRAEIICQHCEGNFIAKRTDVECPDCKGKGGLLIVPETSKTLPTTGVVVSVGPKVEDPRIVPGVRVLTGAFVGTMIPIKGGELRFKVVREHEAQVMITGGEDLAAFDFIEVDIQGTETY